MNQVELFPGRTIGAGHPSYIIAEAGSNHDGDYAQACKLIDVAVAAKADAVKFQTFTADQLYSKKTPMFDYLKDGGLVKEGESTFDVLKRLEMPREWLPDLMAYAKERDIEFLSTPFDLPAVDLLVRLGMRVIKVASFEITHLPLIGHVARTGLPTIMSTGTADLGDIETAMATFRDNGGEKLALLHCSSSYPAPFPSLNLRAMDTIRTAFQVPVGFSDHSVGISADIAAAALGASVIEKHFTIDRTLDGPDHPYALEPDELTAMVSGIREAEAALGSPIKRPNQAEEEMHRLARRSLVAACDIPAGTAVTAEMLAVKRPGFGIPTRQMSILIGRSAKRDIEEDEILVWDSFN